MAILMGILLGVLWHSLNRNCKQHEKIIGAIPKLLTQLRADLREVEKKGKLVLPADRVRIWASSPSRPPAALEHHLASDSRSCGCGRLEGSHGRALGTCDG